MSKCFVCDYKLITCVFSSLGSCMHRFLQSLVNLFPTQLISVNKNIKSVLYFSVLQSSIRLGLPTIRNFLSYRTLKKNPKLFSETIPSDI